MTFVNKKTKTNKTKNKYRKTISKVSFLFVTTFHKDVCAQSENKDSKAADLRIKHWVILLHLKTPVYRFSERLLWVRKKKKRIWTTEDIKTKAEREWPLTPQWEPASYDIPIQHSTQSLTGNPPSQSGKGGWDLCTFIQISSLKSWCVWVKKIKNFIPSNEFPKSSKVKMFWHLMTFGLMRWL